jgi:carboxyl-terminal processing protease
MTYRLRRVVLGLAVVSLSAGIAQYSIRLARGDAPAAPAAATQPDVQATASADATPAVPTPITTSNQTPDQLKTDAYAALTSGDFDRSSRLLTRAAAISQNATDQQMADWTNQFDTQEQTFMAERLKQYNKRYANVNALLAHQMDDFALDEAVQAYLFAADKTAFDGYPWVQQLVKNASANADTYESSEQWLKALRLYSDLSAIEPTDPQWKDKLKLVTRRISLLGLYAPDSLKAMQDVELKARAAADNVIKPTTQPTTQPLADSEDSFQSKWQDALQGINQSMLLPALDFAEKNYYRDTTYKQLLLGGLNGLKLLATTSGLEKAFPNLSDAGKRKNFVAMLDTQLAAANAVDDVEDDQRDLMEKTITTIISVNQDTLQLDESVWVHEFATGAFSTLDPFSTMIWPDELPEFNKTTQGQFGGVGIQIQSDDDGSLRVVSPLEDSPALLAGIKAYDIIERIDGKLAKGITVDQAVKTIAGTPGTQVTLSIRSPDGSVRDVTLTRAVIKVASVKGYLHKPGGGWDYDIDPVNKIAYVHLTSFTRTSSEELDLALNQLKAEGAKGIILDLRYNPGGLLQAATEICNKFVGEGTIVSTHPDRYTPVPPSVADAKPEDLQTDVKLVLLVNQYSASASEIVSGCLKDHKRALIVGERTFGKGSVQMMFPLAGDTACLKLTTAHYYLPNGRCIHREENSKTWGVDPDVTVEMTPDQMRQAIDARQNMDILRDPSATQPTGAKAALDPMKVDPQLDAALLVMRLELDGATL